MKRQQQGKSDKTADYKEFKSKQSNSRSNRASRRQLDKDFGDNRGKFAKEMKGYGPNDIKWRSNTALAKLAATLPFGYPAGLPFTALKVLSTSTKTKVIVCGIMAIRLLITMGRANDYNAGVNLATRKIYSFVRHANSGSKNYDAVDMALYFGSFGQAAGALGYLQRIYRLITSFSSTNRYTPRELIVANGVDYDDIKKHQAELAWLIRWFGNALNSLAVPKMPYFSAAYYTFTKVYEDNTSPKNQFYIFIPEAFGVYNPTYNSNGGGIDYKNAATTIPALGTLFTYADLYTMVHTIMDVLLSDEDIGIISGDILKAYGESGLFKCESEPDVDLKPEHSPEILQQVHNATCVPGELLDFLGYKQNPGSTSTAPYLELDVGGTSLVINQGSTDRLMEVEQYIDAFSAEPNAEEIINCCVLKASCRWKAGSAANTFVPDVTTADFDMYLPRRIISYFGIGSQMSWVYPTISSIGDVCRMPILTAAYVNTSLVQNAAYSNSQFDWHPLIVLGDAGTFNSFGGSIFGDVQNINFFDDVVFTRIHDTAVLSLFNFTE